jgi:hypothetical protein
MIKSGKKEKVYVCKRKNGMGKKGKEKGVLEKDITCPSPQAVSASQPRTIRTCNRQAGVGLNSAMGKKKRRCRISI